MRIINVSADIESQRKIGMMKNDKVNKEEVKQEVELRVEKSDCSEEKKEKKRGKKDKETIQPDVTGVPVTA